MKLIISTDLGHDPDDLFTILYLIATGIDIKLLIVTPGDLDQLAIAHFIRDELNLDYTICASKESTKMSSGSVHHDLLNSYKYPLKKTATTDAQEHIDATLRTFPESEALVIGPPKSIGHYFSTPEAKPLNRLTMQGGFLPYNLHTFPAQRLDKFENKHTIGTFNMNGDPKGTMSIVNSPNILSRSFVVKNVCHTIKFTQDRLSSFATPQNRAGELFLEAAYLYFKKNNGKEKQFHDPLASYLHLFPEKGTWVKGRPFRAKGEWGTQLDAEGDNVLADVDRESFWEHLTSVV